MKIILLVTIYNKLLEDSTSLYSFFFRCQDYHDKIQLYIWDNSDKFFSQDLSFIPTSVHYRYYKSPINMSLSKVYNTVIKDHNDFDFFINFDQDSSFSCLYFDILFNSIQNYIDDVALYAPQIVYNSKCVSPARKGIIKNHYINEMKAGVYNSKNMLVITSGVVVDLRCLRDVGLQYDENLSLYGIDLKFSIDYSRYFDKICVLDYSLDHDLSRFDSQENKSTKLFRLKNSFKADCYIASLGRYSLFAYLYLYARYIYNKIAILLANKC